MNLDTLIETLDKEVDFNTDESFAQAGAPLHQFASNDDALDQIVSRLTNDLTQALNPYVSSTFYVSLRPKYTLRMNMWFGQNQATSATERLFDFDNIHDHNYSFITAGIAGPGYSTVMHEYDGRIPQVGQGGLLYNESHHKLTKGKVLLFRAGRDVHKQFRPRALSLSLNIIPKRPITRPRIIFNEDGTVKTVQELDSALAAVNLFRFLKHTSGPFAEGLRIEAAESCENPRLRALLIAAIANR